MDTNGYTLSDISAVTNGMNGNLGGNNIVTLLLLFGLISGGFGWNKGDYGQYATAASQQEILFNQHFNNLDNKMDRGFTSIGNGISDATFALNNTIVNGNNMVAGTVVSESRGIQDKLYDVKTAVHTDGEATRAMIQQNKIDSLQRELSTVQNQLALQNAMCGVPKINPYMYGIVPTYSGCNCNCGNI